MEAREFNPARKRNFGPFILDKVPGIEYQMTSVPIPSISVGSASVSNSQGNPISVPGDLEFSNVKIEFIVDEMFENYKIIWDWCMKIGYDNQRYSLIGDEWATGSFSILNNNSKAIAFVTFYDCFPTELSQVEFSSTDGAEDIVTASFTLNYVNFEIDFY